MKPKFYHFVEHGDSRGKLAVVEPGKDIEFPIRRIYYIYGADSNQRRGFHAHKRLEQVLLCVHGSCKVMLDDGSSRCDVTLDSPTLGLYVGNAMWREMYDFTPDAVLLVLASEPYTEADYIRNYDEFLKYVKRGGQPE